MGYLELGLGDLRDSAHRMVKGDNFGALTENVVACGCDNNFCDGLGIFMHGHRH
jgi:hypothetical protein